MRPALTQFLPSRAYPALSTFLLLLAVFLLGTSCVLGGVGGRAQLLDPKALLLLIATADSCVLDGVETKDVPLSPGKGSALKTPVNDTSTLIEDSPTVTALVRQLHPLELKPSSYCFCTGQPRVRFFRQNEYLGWVRVKHDDNIELGDANGCASYFTGRSNLVRDFYEVLSPVIKRAKAASASSGSTTPSLAQEAELQSSKLKQQVEAERKEQDASIKQLPVPPISVPSLEQSN